MIGRAIQGVLYLIEQPAEAVSQETQPQQRTKPPSTPVRFQRLKRRQKCSKKSKPVSGYKCIPCHRCTALQQCRVRVNSGEAALCEREFNWEWDEDSIMNEQQFAVGDLVRYEGSTWRVVALSASGIYLRARRAGNDYTCHLPWEIVRGKVRRMEERQMHCEMCSD